MAIGYIFLVISVLAGTTKGYFGKQISGKTQGMAASTWANILRMGFCILISLLVSGASLLQNGAKIDLALILTGLFSGITQAAFLISWLYCVRGGGYMLVTIFTMLGIVVTLILSTLFLPGETISLLQWLAVALLIIAVFIMYSYNAGMQGKLSAGTMIALVICGLSHGLSSFAQKLFQVYSVGDTGTFTLIGFVVTLLALLCLLLLPSVKQEQVKPGKLIKGIFFPVLIMAIALFLCNFFAVEAAAPGRLSAVQLYPAREGLNMLMGVLMSHFLLKERANVRCVIGCVLAFIATLLLQ